eukprot:TRINITY_DN1890_c0_g2_i6.p1 TRINITY_DN1890_c0_g2~~TRINITY_DN1890_c0_g2_i6.p1  ORF type:complete len:183 (-),score=19.96 TRINITY_DN1890_c0_g2_i6:459-1007(-)
MCIRDSPHPHALHDAGATQGEVVGYYGAVSYESGNPGPASQPVSYESGNPRPASQPVSLYDPRLGPSPPHTQPYWPTQGGYPAPSYPSHPHPHPAMQQQPYMPQGYGGTGPVLFEQQLPTGQFEQQLPSAEYGYDMNLMYSPTYSHDSNLDWSERQPSQAIPIQDVPNHKQNGGQRYSAMRL